MAKAKKTTGSEEPRKSAKKTAKKKSSKPTVADTPLVDTDAAARLAALMIAKRVELPAASSAGGKPSPTIQQLKQAHIPGVTAATHSILGPKKPLGHAHNEQRRNQTLGHDNRYVPRRTPG